MRSDLHDLVKLLKQAPGSWTADQVAREMKKISAVKWQKYARTRTYLQREIPNLTTHLRAKPIGFRTVSMSSEMNDTILRHVFKWESDTGSLQDLATVFTREKVTWPQWSTPLVACIGLPHGAAYTIPGQHVGLAINPANMGRGQDDHALLGPFNGTILNHQGQTLTASMDQTYEYSHDRVNWHPIPDSDYSIVREVSNLPNGQVQLTITKTNKTNLGDRFVVRKSF